MKLFSTKFCKNTLFLQQKRFEMFYHCKFDLRYLSLALLTLLKSIRDYFGGRTAMIKTLKGSEMPLNLPPLCCLCPYLPILEFDAYVFFKFYN